MRPVKLTMQAFGPYREQESVDFRELGPNRVFLIHGDTGAGKTTILDAMVFALYGDTSGGERKADQMRCESAPPALPTEVVFDFSLGERSFRVRRRPTQMYVGARGGVVEKPAEVALWDRTGCAGGDEGRPLATKITDANVQIKQLLGFSCDQFRQVVVLPQGKFRELLSSGSDKREEILRQLFRTERFRELEQALFERARAVRRQMEQLEADRRAQLDVVGATDDAALTALLEVAGGELQAADEAVLQTEAVARAAAEVLNAAEAADEARRAVDAAKVEVESLEAQAGEMAQVRLQLETAARADRVRPSAERLTEAVARAVEARELRGRREQYLSEARRAESAAAEALGSESARSAERQAAAGRVRDLERWTEAFEAWRSAEADHQTAREVLATAVVSSDQAQQALSRAEEALAELKQRLAAGRTAAVQLAGVRSRHQQAEQAKDRCARLIAAHEAVQEAERRCAAHAAAETAARAAKLSAEEELDAVERRWRAGRASALAAALRPGEPCPVCGSTQHPAPAVVDAGAISDQQLEAGKSAAASAARVHIEASEASAASKNSLTAARTTEEAIRRELGEAAGLSLTEAASAVATCLAELEELTAQAQIDDVEAALPAAEAAAGAAATAAKDAAAARSSAELDVAAKEARLIERAAGIPDELRAAGALESALSEARREQTELEQALVTAQQRAKEATEARIAVEVAAQNATAAETQAAERQSVCRDALEAALSGNGFSEEREWQMALLSESARAALEERVARHRDELQQARGRQQQAELAVARSSAPVDLTEARSAAQAADYQHRETMGRQAEARSRLATIAGVRQRLAEIDGRSDDVRQAYQTVGVLSEVANGQNPGRVSFQRWVLGVYLDEVLVGASRKLYAMSKGRYGLQRQREVASRGRPSGLDLAVSDEFSGTARPAVTLSGGESFLAALALALALAETVEEHAGGTRLETIFVDEGFGALDADALELAIDALMELQLSGRLVGVISHVPELKQVIPARLEVSGGSAGSSTRFFVP